MPISVDTLALTCLVLLGAGYVLLGLLGTIPKFRTTVAEAWPILFTETVIVGVVVAALWIGGWVLTLALLAHAIRVGWEAGMVAKLSAPLPLGLGLAAMAWVAALAPAEALAVAGIVGLGATVFVLRAAAGTTDQTRRGFLNVIAFPGFPLVLFTAAGIQGGWEAWLLATFILVETFDSYALLGGKLFGRTKAFPVLSPRKTIEGLASGAIMLMLTAAFAGSLLADVSIWLSAIVALGVGILAVIGDLTASRLKRMNAVKDYPAVMSLQGGVFDITDAWIAASAGMFVIVALFGA